jgi:hypothetical protein
MSGHRPFTYVILALNALFLIWLIPGVELPASDVPDWCYMAGEAKHWPSLCGAGNIGTAVAVVILWGFVDVILGVLWLVTNGRHNAKKAAEATPAVDSEQ